MNTQHDAEPIPFPVHMYNHPRMACIAETTLEEMVALFGDPTGLEDPGDPGPIERWAFRYPCGLQLVYELSLLHDQTLVLPDVPELAHVARHLPFEPDRVSLMTAKQLDEEMAKEVGYHPERQAELDSLRAVQVWRQGDDGNKFSVGDPTTERAAQCYVAELEGRHHKQAYWYSAT